MKGTEVNIPRSNTDKFYRYKMPIIQTKIEGKGNGIRTVVPNMGKVMKALDRPLEYGAKFIGMELGTKSKIDEKQNNCVFAGKHSEGELSKCLDKFIDMYVLCVKCKNPETIFEVKKGCIVSKCKACGKIFKVDPTHKLSNYIIKSDTNKKPVEEKKMSPKKSKIKDDDKDYESWTMDTSAEAVASRKQQLLNGCDGQESKSDMFPMENLLKYIQSCPEEDEFVEEMLKLMHSQAWSESVLIKYIFATLFSDGNIRENFNTKVVYLEYFANSSKDMAVILMCIEKFMEEHCEYIGQMVHILNGFYEAYVLDDDAIFKWHDGKSKSVSAELGNDLRESSKPFIEWLENAEEVDDI